MYAFYIKKENVYILHTQGNPRATPKGCRQFWGGLYRLFCRNQWKGCQISTSQNSPVYPAYPADPAETVPAGVPQTLPSTRAGGQDDVS